MKRSSSFRCLSDQWPRPPTVGRLTPNSRFRCLSTQAVVLSPLIAEIQQYIEDDFVHIDIDQIAQQTGYSSGYLMRLVKAKTGKTLGTLINESRLRQVSALLLTTNDTVAQVGKAVGFQSLSYFHKRFQECYGLTPKQYRDAFPKYLPEE